MSLSAAFWQHKPIKLQSKLPIDRSEHGKKTSREGIAYTLLPRPVGHIICACKMCTKCKCKHNSNVPVS